MKKILTSLLILVCLMVFPKTIIAANAQYLDIKIGYTTEKNIPIEISSDSSIYVISSDQNKVMDLYSKEILVTLKENKIIISNKNNTIFSKDFPNNGALMLTSKSGLKYGKYVYSGNIFFKSVKEKLNVINNVELETYLKGVVPNELSEEYPIEALKAQAVTSRSFALNNINKYKKLGYNLDDTTNCQVYRGKTSEKTSTNLAVDSTKGIVALYNGKVANTIFGASSGGTIAAVNEIWGGNEISYLKTKSDPYSSKYVWSLTLKKEDFIKILSDKYEIKDILSVSVSDKDSSGRANKIKIVTDNTVFQISGNGLRSLIGSTKMKSTLIDINFDSNMITISGKGYGHGVGFSQYGAVEMAKQNKNYKEIMEFYFPGVNLEKK